MPTAPDITIWSDSLCEALCDEFSVLRTKAHKINALDESSALRRMSIAISPDPIRPSYLQVYDLVRAGLNELPEADAEVLADLLWLDYKQGPNPRRLHRDPADPMHVGKRYDHVADRLGISVSNVVKTVEPAAQIKLAQAVYTVYRAHDDHGQSLDVPDVLPRRATWREINQGEGALDRFVEYYRAPNRKYPHEVFITSGMFARSFIDTPRAVRELLRENATVCVLVSHPDWMMRPYDENGPVDSGCLDEKREKLTRALKNMKKELEDSSWRGRFRVRIYAFRPVGTVYIADPQDPDGRALFVPHAPLGFDRPRLSFHLDMVRQQRALTNLSRRYFDGSEPARDGDRDCHGIPWELWYQARPDASVDDLQHVINYVAS